MDKTQFDVEDQDHTTRPFKPPFFNWVRVFYGPKEEAADVKALLRAANIETSPGSSIHMGNNVEIQVLVSDMYAADAIVEEWGRVR